MSMLEHVIQNRWHVETGDAIETLSRLPDECIQTCITSPPYYGLRQYLFDGAVILRTNLTAEEVEYVTSELRRRGINPVMSDSQS